LHKDPGDLPISANRRDLVWLVQSCQVVFVVGEPGIGKGTQIPQYLFEAGFCGNGKTIGVTCPSRMRAEGLATRLNMQMNPSFKGEMKSQQQTMPTNINYVVDSVLVRYILKFPNLDDYSVIMVDDAHERNLNTEILLALLKKIVKQRSDLKVIVNCGQEQVREFFKFFTGAELSEATNGPASSLPMKAGIIPILGNMQSCPVFYLSEPTADYITAAVDTVFWILDEEKAAQQMTEMIHNNKKSGDILIFLPNTDSALQAFEIFFNRYLALGEQVPKLHGRLLHRGISLEKQQEAVQPAPQDARKVIFSAEIAERVSIPGVVYVIDTLFCQKRFYSVSTGMNTLCKRPITKAHAEMRARSAKICPPGENAKVYRLCTEDTYAKLENAPIPETSLQNLAPILLKLMALTVSNVLKFDYLTPPPPLRIGKALEYLWALGLVDIETGQPTSLEKVRRVAELDMDPMMAKALLDASSFGCLSLMITIAAMNAAITDSGDLLWVKRVVTHRGMDEATMNAKARFDSGEGDPIVWVNVFYAYSGFAGQTEKERRDWCRRNCLNYDVVASAVDIRAQLAQHMQAFGFPRTETLLMPLNLHEQGGNHEESKKVRRCLAAAYFMNAGKVGKAGEEGWCTTPAGARVFWHEKCVVFKQPGSWVVFADVTRYAGRARASVVTPVERPWFGEFASHYY
ncbi:hypothetical protein NA57DRAFT_11739, partial [Rhizodiscina lignyota]